MTRRWLRRVKWRLRQYTPTEYHEFFLFIVVCLMLIYLIFWPNTWRTYGDFMMSLPEHTLDVLFTTYAVCLFAYLISGVAAAIVHIAEFRSEREFNDKIRAIELQNLMDKCQASDGELSPHSDTQEPDGVLPASDVESLSNGQALPHHEERIVGELPQSPISQEMP